MVCSPLASLIIPHYYTLIYSGRLGGRLLTKDVHHLPSKNFLFLLPYSKWNFSWCGSKESHGGVWCPMSLDEDAWSLSRFWVPQFSASLRYGNFRCRHAWNPLSGSHPWLPAAIYYDRLGLLSSAWQINFSHIQPRSQGKVVHIFPWFYLNSLLHPFVSVMATGSGMKAPQVVFLCFCQRDEKCF